MKSVTVRGVTFGAGRAGIAAPIMASDAEGILREAAAVRALPIDVVEWRADQFAALRSGGEVRELLRALRTALGGLPLLFTIRTRAEGGSAALSAQEYLTLNELAAESGCADLVDVEAFGLDASAAVAHVDALHARGVCVVASRHDFDGTPEEKTMRGILTRLCESGADIVKLAVTPRREADVLALLSASVWARGALDRPFITISMGQLGAVSRVACSLTGSCLTFAAGEQASAPGQLGAAELRRMLDALG